VRVHMVNTLVDVMGSVHTKGWPLNDAIKRIADADSGVVVILRKNDESQAMLQWMMSHLAVGDSKKTACNDIRTDGVGAQILMDVGVKKMRLLSAPKVIHGLAGFGLEVVEYVSGED